jgi:hypothetical protein
LFYPIFDQQSAEAGSLHEKTSIHFKDKELYMPGVIAVQRHTDTSTIVTATNFEGKLNDMVIPMKMDEFLKSFGKWQAGALIQNTFPTLNGEQREFILTGTTEEEWNEMFPKEE